MNTKRKLLILIPILAVAALCVVLLVHFLGPQEKSIRIIGTSDLHGKFYPVSYATNTEDRHGSMLQLSSAINEYRTDNTLIMDAGDTLQANSAEIFMDDEIHPMIDAMNYIGYDICLTGNHEYDYELDPLLRQMGKCDAHLLTGNVYLPDGKPMADGYTIIKKDGIRIAVIGMTTPNIARWSESNLKGCTVTDPLEETRKIIDSIQGKYDVLVGVFHMGIDNELGTPNSGVTDICNACPEFDIMISSHEHRLIESMDINGVLVVQNSMGATSMSVIDIDLERVHGKWEIADKSATAVKTEDYPDDEKLAGILKPYDEKARADSLVVVGRLEGEAAEEEKNMYTEDNAATDLVNDVMLYYSEADVSANQISNPNVKLKTGDLRKCDISQIYVYANTLWKVRMNGAQFKKFMEWGVSYFATNSGSEPISYAEDFPPYFCSHFAGVNYEVNLTKETGSRIENLTWPDGSPVKDDEVFTVAVNNYVASSVLLNPGELYDENDLPELVEQDVHSEIGGIRDMLYDYIVNVNGGVIAPEADNNWRITGVEE